MSTEAGLGHGSIEMVLGGINAETVAEAHDFAREIAAEHERRVRLTVDGRGLVGQLMWTIYAAETLGAT